MLKNESEREIGRISGHLSPSPTTQMVSTHSLTHAHALSLSRVCVSKRATHVHKMYRVSVRKRSCRPQTSRVCARTYLVICAIDVVCAKICRGIHSNTFYSLWVNKYLESPLLGRQNPCYSTNIIIKGSLNCVFFWIVTCHSLKVGLENCFP